MRAHDNTLLTSGSCRTSWPLFATVETGVLLSGRYEPMKRAKAVRLAALLLLSSRSVAQAASRGALDHSPTMLDQAYPESLTLDLIGGTHSPSHSS